MNLDPIRASIAPYLLLIKLGLIVVLAASMFIGGCNHGANKWQGKYDAEVAEHKATKTSHAAVLRDLANKTKAAEDAVKAAGEKAKADRKAADQRFQEATDEAAKARTALARALRAGTVRVREEWTCPAARSAEGGTAGVAGRQDAAPDLRREREAAISDDIAEADAADNWIVWLQAELINTRTACGAKP